MGTVKNDRRGKGTSHLFEAIVRRDLPRVVELLATGADPNEQDGPSGQRPLLAAASGGQVEFVRSLLDAGAEVDATDRDGNTALSNVVYEFADDEPEPYERILEALLERGADPDKENRHGVSPRSLAATIGNSNVEKVLEATIARFSKVATRRKQ